MSNGVFIFAGFKKCLIEFGGEEKLLKVKREHNLELYTIFVVYILVYRKYTRPKYFFVLKKWKPLLAIFQKKNIM